MVIGQEERTPLGHPARSAQRASYRPGSASTNDGAVAVTDDLAEGMGRLIHS